MTIYGVTYFFSCGYTHDFFCTRLTDEIGFTLFVGEMLPKLNGCIMHHHICTIIWVDIAELML